MGGYRGRCSANVGTKFKVVYCDNPTNDSIEDWYFCTQHIKEIKKLIYTRPSKRHKGRK